MQQGFEARLAERDEEVATLRALLADKEARVAALSAGKAAAAEALRQKVDDMDGLREEHAAEVKRLRTDMVADASWLASRAEAEIKQCVANQFQALTRQMEVRRDEMNGGKKARRSP